MVRHIQGHGVPGQRGRQGRAVQVDPIIPMLKAPESKRLNLKHVQLLSNVAVIFNLHRYTKAFAEELERREARFAAVGRCGLTL